MVLLLAVLLFFARNCLKDESCQAVVAKAEEVQDSISETECSERLGAPVRKRSKEKEPPGGMGETEKEIRKKDPPVVLRMGETDLQGQKLYVTVVSDQQVCF